MDHGDKVLVTARFQLPCQTLEHADIKGLHGILLAPGVWRMWQMITDRCHIVGSVPAHTFAAMHKGAYVVGIAGGSGSGKTSQVRALRQRLPEGSVCLVSQDDYYHPKEDQHVDEKGQVNFDLPGAVDMDGLANDLRSLIAGGSIFRKEYTFNQNGRVPGLVELRPAPVILVEGLFVLHHAPVRELFDLRVFIEASITTQLERRLQRDAKERGYGTEEVMYQWKNHVLPAYEQFLLPYRSTCDLQVVNESSFDRAIDVLHDHLLRMSDQVEPITIRDLTTVHSDI